MWGGLGGGRRMKITAIWDRHIPAPKSKMIFCLLDNGELLELRPETEYEGENAEGQRLYKETGKFDSGSFLKEEDRFTFEKADYMVRHFGATLLVNFKSRGINP